jgi:hypothetical protein
MTTTRRPPPVSAARSRSASPARCGAGGQQQLVVADLFAAVEGDLVHGGIEAGGAVAQSQLDVLVGVPGRWVQVDGVPFGRSGQVRLGQRWPFVGGLGLGSYEQDPAGETLLA